MEVSCFQLSKEILIIKSNADVHCSVTLIPNMNMNFYPLHSQVLSWAMPLHRLHIFVCFGPKTRLDWKSTCAGQYVM